MMLGVTFGGKHSYYDYGLLLKSYPVISPPVPKTKLVEIPGADGSLDLTETLTGYVQYENREISMTFTVARPRALWPDIHADFLDDVHGKTMDIIMDDDLEYAYIGRVTVKSLAPDRVTSDIVVTALVEPYKVQLYYSPAYQDIAVDGTRIVSVHGARKPVVPVFSASVAMQMDFAGKTYNLSAGENTFPDVIIRQGDNALTFTGTGTVSILYKEGRF